MTFHMVFVPCVYFIYIYFYPSRLTNDPGTATQRKQSRSTTESSSSSGTCLSYFLFRPRCSLNTRLIVQLIYIVCPPALLMCMSMSLLSYSYSCPVPSCHPKYKSLSHSINVLVLSVLLNTWPPCLKMVCPSFLTYSLTHAKL